MSRTKVVFEVVKKNTIPFRFDTIICRGSLKRCLLVMKLRSRIDNSDLYSINRIEEIEAEK